MTTTFSDLISQNGQIDPRTLAQSMEQGQIAMYDAEAAALIKQQREIMSSTNHDVIAEQELRRQAQQMQLEVLQANALNENDQSALTQHMVLQALAASQQINMNANADQLKTAQEMALRGGYGFGIAQMGLELENIDDKMLTPELRQMKQRKLLLIEFLDTEQAYLNDLYVFLNQYVNPIETLLPVENSEDVRFVLVHLKMIEMIYQANRQCFIDVLSIPKNSVTILKLSHALVELQKNLAVYTSFCCQYEETIDKIKELRDRIPALNSLLIDSQERAYSKLGINDYVSKPFQRLMKYPLLLREMVKNTIDPQEKAILQATSIQIGKSINEVNEKKTISDNRKKMFYLVANVEGITQDFIIPNRSLIHESDCIKVNRRGKAQKRHCFLLNDCFIYCTNGKKLKYKVCKKIAMKDILVTDYPEPQKMPTEFVLKVTKYDEKSAGKNVFLCFNQRPEKLTWLKHFEQCRLEFLRSKTAAITSLSVPSQKALQDFFTPQLQTQSQYQPEQQQLELLRQQQMQQHEQLQMQMQMQQPQQQQQNLQNDYDGTHQAREIAMNRAAQFLESF